MRELFKHLGHRSVKVDLDGVVVIGIAEMFRNERTGVGVHLFKPYALGVDFRLDVAVGTTGDTETDGAAGPMSRQSYDPHVVGEGFAPELRSESNLVRLEEQSLLELDIAEGTSRVVAGGGQRIIVVGRGEFDGEEVLLGRGASDDKGNMVRRAGCRSETAHLLNEKRNERVLVLDARFGLLIEVGLVSGSAALGDEEESVFVVVCGFDVNLRGEIATRVDLTVHIERRVL